MIFTPHQQSQFIYFLCVTRYTSKLLILNTKKAGDNHLLC